MMVRNRSEFTLMLEETKWKVCIRTCDAQESAVSELSLNGMLNLVIRL